MLTHDEGGTDCARVAHLAHKTLFVVSHHVRWIRLIETEKLWDIVAKPLYTVNGLRERVHLQRFGCLREVPAHPGRQPGTVAYR